jgi:hypothetical protein
MPQDPRVKEVLVDRGQLVLEDLVQVLSDGWIAAHLFLPSRKAFSAPAGRHKGGRLAPRMLRRGRAGVSIIVSGCGERTQIREHLSHERNALPALRPAAEAPVYRGNGTLFFSDGSDLAIGKSIAEANVHSILSGKNVNRSQLHSQILDEAPSFANENLS